MAKIHKFPLGTYEQLREGVVAELPLKFEAVHMGFRDGVLFLWAQVDPSDPVTPAAFTVVGTGRALPLGFEHVFTYQDGPYVGHVGTVPLPAPSVTNIFVDVGTADDASVADFGGDPTLATAPTASGWD